MTSVDSGRFRRRSTLELVKDLTHQASTLVHQEVELVKLEVRENVELAKVEMTEKAKTAGTGVALLAAAGAAGLLALGALSAFLILALDGVMPNWAAASVRCGDLAGRRRASWRCTGAGSSTKWALRCRHEQSRQ